MPPADSVVPAQPLTPVTPVTPSTPGGEGVGLPVRGPDPVAPLPAADAGASSSLDAGEAPVDFQLPAGQWHLLLDTAAPGGGVSDPYPLGARALALLDKARYCAPSRRGG